MEQEWHLGGLSGCYRIKCALIELVITFDGTYPKDQNYTQMCTVALFIITKTWKQPRRPSVGK